MSNPNSKQRANHQGSGSDERNLPRFEDVSDADYGKVEFRSRPFFVEMIEKFPPFEETIKEVLRESAKGN